MTLDFNHQPTLSEKLNFLIDEALSDRQKQQKPREYLGASRVGVTCSRALQFELTNTPKDADKGFKGKTLRIFEAGHIFEDLAIQWLSLAGFSFCTRTSDGSQIGFSVADGKLQGHVDGIITDTPKQLGLSGFPMLWECKSLNAKSWKETVNLGVVKSKPIYAAQIAIYQAYLESNMQGISKHPALFTAINKDTAELHHELVIFDSALAQQMSDKAVRILAATEAGELLPPISRDITHAECQFCAWATRCRKFETERAK